MATELIDSLRRKRKLRSALNNLMKDSDFQFFFAQLLRDCNVTRPKISKDPGDVLFNEGRRHLAMSYLALMARDDPSYIIDALEKEHESRT